MFTNLPRQYWMLMDVNLAGGLEVWNMAVMFSIYWEE
jgi:hypothetical protein